MTEALRFYDDNGFLYESWHPSDEYVDERDSKPGEDDWKEADPDWRDGE